MYSLSGLYTATQEAIAGLAGGALQSHNGKIIFPVYSGDLEEDQWGNPIPSEEEEITLLVKFTPKKDPNTMTTVNPGLNIGRVYVEGYLVDPFTYENPLPRQADAEYLYQGNWRKGRFYNLDSLPTALDEAIDIDAVLGQKITGYFEVLENE
jgi:hypothetical protein